MIEARVLGGTKVISAVVFFAVGLGSPVAHVWVGKPGLTMRRAQKAAARVGDVDSRSQKGLYRVRLKSNQSFCEAKQVLLGQGFTYVFPGDAVGADPADLGSVRTHLALCRASADILGVDAEAAGVDFYEALEYYLEPRVGKDGKLDQAGIKAAAKHRDQMPDSGDGRFNPAGVWSHIGPFGMDVPYRTYYGVPPLSGRKSDAAFASTNTNIIYTASAGGGIWKTVDGGINWTPKSDGWQFLHTSSVAVSPADANLVLAGTGDYVGFFTAQTFGIMRSTDGGTTWTNIGAAQFGDKIVSKIVFDPANPNIVVASTGRAGGSLGDIWRSTDAGLTWARTNAPDGNWDDIDVSTKSLTPGNFRFWACGGGTNGTKIAYSDDKGATWTSVARPAGFSATEPIMNIAASAADADGVYVIAPTNDKVYKSMNGGAAWSDITTGVLSWSQDTYNIHITVGGYQRVEPGTITPSPRVTDVIYVGLITLYGSDDGGTTWVDIAGTATSTAKWHNDQHFMTINPKVQNRSLIGGDGGIASMIYDPNSNSASITPLSNTISDEQFYAIAVHPTNHTFVMGGTQDNASPASRGNMTTWDNLWAGDGCFCGFNRTSPGTHYTTSQGGAVYRYDSPLDTSPTSIPTGFSGPFVTPLAMGNTNFTDPFTTTGNMLRRYNGSSWIASTTTLSSNARVIVTARLNGQRIFTCHTNGDVYMSTNNGGTLTKIDGNLPNNSIGAVYESTTTPFDVVAVLQTTSTSVGRAYRCTNVNVASPVWTDISGSGSTALPKTPFNTVVRDPHHSGTFYAGSDLGVFMTTNSGTTWTNMNALGLPNVHVNQLVISDDSTYLYAGTYGRGIWRIPIGL